MTLALVVGAVGGAACVLRYLVDSAVRRRQASDFPLGTMVVNVAGSFILGVVTGVAWYHGLSSGLRAVVAVGFCGGLTTWSAASWESVRLAEGRRFAQALTYTLGTMGLALAVAVGGTQLAAVL